AGDPDVQVANEEPAVVVLNRENAVFLGDDEESELEGDDIEIPVRRNAGEQLDPADRIGLHPGGGQGRFAELLEGGGLEVDHRREERAVFLQLLEGGILLDRGSELVALAEDLGGSLRG